MIDDSRDEDPDSSDIDRLDHGGAWCPECGSEVWEGAEHCPSCGAYFSMASSRPPREAARRRALLMIAIALAAIGMLLFVLLSI